MCSHAWPIKLILIDDKFVTMTIDDDSDMEVAEATYSKMWILHTNLPPNSIEDLQNHHSFNYKSHQFTIWSQSALLFLSYGVQDLVGGSENHCINPPLLL